MNVLVTDTTLSPASIEEECAKIIVEETMSPFVLHNVTIPGEQYTLSLWVKSNNVGSITSRGTTVSTSHEWTRYSATFTTEDTDISIYFNTIDTYYIYHAKLEIGNKATDYTVAPEDTDEAIKSADEAAKDADKKATDADKKATDADKKAADAKDKADDANKLANETSKAVTSHMIFNQTENSGLELGDYSTGKWSGFRARIAANVFEIIDSSNKVVAKYGIAEILLGYGIARYTTNTIELGRGSDNAEIILCDGVARYTKDMIELGKGSDNAKILLCDGNGEIKMDADKDFMLIHGDAISLSSDHEVTGEIIDGSIADSEYWAKINISTNTSTNERSVFLSSNSSHVSEDWLTERGHFSSVLLNEAGVAIEAGDPEESGYKTGVYLNNDHISMNTCTYDEYLYGYVTSHIQMITGFLSLYGDLAVNNNASVTGDLTVNANATIDNTLTVAGRQYGVNKVLWTSTGWWMQENHTATLSEAITAQPHGVVLLFSVYHNDGVEDYGWQSFFIPKHLVGVDNSGGTELTLSHHEFQYVGTKYLYIDDTQIKGFEGNTLSGTAENTGIIYDNSKWVMRYVIGV